MPRAAATPERRQPAGRVTLEPIDLERHGALLATWRAAPHVTRWWLEPSTPLEGIDSARHEHALIAIDGVPAGYVRWTPRTAEELAAVGLDDIPEGSIDIDILIGEAGRTGRGVGPQALRLLLGRLKSETTAPLAGLCTSIENAHAIAAFQKAGFRKHAQFDDPHHGRMWLLLAEVSGRLRM